MKGLRLEAWGLSEPPVISSEAPSRRRVERSPPGRRLSFPGGNPSIPSAPTEPHSLGITDHSGEVHSISECGARHAAQTIPRRNRLSGSQAPLLCRINEGRSDRAPSLEPQGGRVGLHRNLGASTLLRLRAGGVPDYVGGQGDKQTEEDRAGGYSRQHRVALDK